MIKNLLRNAMRRIGSANEIELVRKETSNLRERIETLLVLQAQSATNAVVALPPIAPLDAAEFRVFSQFGEDGILQFLVAHAEIQANERIFVEFGVETYAEANTRLLLLKDYWRGLVLDGSSSNIAAIRADSLYWRHDLTAVQAWIERDNINQLIGDAGFSGEIGVLSIDVDGNDYWVLEAISVVRPVILVLEWNAIYGPEWAVTVPYKRDFQRTQAHFSNLYWGASIVALQRLASDKGYELIGSNRAGNNIFFVRRDRMGSLPRRTAKECYRAPCFREARTREGALTFLPAMQNQHLICDLPLIDVVSGRQTCLRELDESCGLLNLCDTTVPR